MTESSPEKMHIHHAAESVIGSHIEGGSLDMIRKAIDRARRDLQEDLHDVEMNWPGLLDGDEAQLEHLVQVSKVSGGLQALNVLQGNLGISLELSDNDIGDAQQRLFSPEDL